MKQHPILFSTPLVQAILEGRKTMTRRIIKPQPQKINGPIMGMVPNHPGDWAFPENGDFRSSMISCKPNGPTDWGRRNCPYGWIGDILWVREMIYQNGELGLNYVADDEWIDEEIIPEDHKPYRNYAFCNIPSIHMPKWACRLYLEITGIRVERLRDITKEDSEREGVEQLPNGHWKHYCAPKFDTINPLDSFCTLWISINGRQSYQDDPWVWVIEFKKIAKP